MKRLLTLLLFLGVLGLSQSKAQAMEPRFPGCDEEVLRLLSLMPNWLPGTDDAGAAIDTPWEMEVKFK